MLSSLAARKGSAAGSHRYLMLLNLRQAYPSLLKALQVDFDGLLDIIQSFVDCFSLRDAARQSTYTV